MKRMPLYWPFAWGRSIQNLPSLSIPSRISPSFSSRLSGFTARGMVAWNPAVISGVTIMKMINNTSITSIIGVTLMLALTAALALTADRATGLARLLGLEFLGEDRAAELRPDTADQVVDQLLGSVGHLDRDEVDLGREVVVEPHRRNRRDETDGGRDERLGNSARHRTQRAAAARGHHAREGVHDTHRRAEQTDERRRSPDRRQDAEAAFQLGHDDQHLALDRALGGVDVGRGDRRPVPQQRLHFGQRLTQHARD